MKIYIKAIVVLTLLLESSILVAQLPSDGKSKGAYTAFKNAEKKFFKGNLEGGENNFERAAKRYEETGDVDGYIASKAMEAIVLLNKDKPKDAFRAFRYAEELYNAQPNHNEATTAYLNLCLGKYHLYYDEQKEANTYLEEAEKIATKKPEYVSQVFNIELQQSKGKLKLKQGDKKAALTSFEKATDLVNNLPAEDKNQDYINSQFLVADDLYEEVLEPDEVAERYSQMIVHADSSRMGTVRLKTGRSYFKYTEYETAYEHLENALKYDLTPAQEAETKSMLATIAMSIKDYQDALEKNGDALAIQLKIGASPRDLYDGFIKQGTICKELDVVGKTLYWYKKTVKNISEDWTLEKELDAYGLEPVEHLKNPVFNENFTIALLNFERADRLVAKLPKHEQDVARVEVDMAKGSLYFEAHNFDQSKMFYLEALGLMPQIYPEKHPLVAEATRHMSEISVHQKLHQEGLSYINRSINASTKENAPIVKDYELPNPEHGLYPYELLYSTITKAAVLYHLDCHSPNLTEEKLLHSLQISDLSMQMLVKLRATYRTEGAKYELSELSEKISHQAIQTASRLQTMSPKTEYLQRLFGYIETSKSALLLQAVQQLRAQKVSGVPDWVVEKENKLKTKIAYLSGEIYYEAKRGKDMDKTKIDELEKELEEAEKAYPEYLDYVEKTYPDYFTLKYKQKTVGLTELQGKLAHTEILINYVVVDSFIHTMLIDKKNIVYKYTPAPHRLNYAVAKYISTLKGEKPDDFIKYSNVWYEALVKPIEKYLDGRNMVIIPDAELNYLPFELIPTASLSQAMSKGKKDYSMYKKVPYLLRKGSVSYNYSATLFLDARAYNYKDVPDGFLGLAPDFTKIEDFKLNNRYQKSKYDDLVLAPLENAAIEVKSIGKLAGGKTFIGVNATEQAFKNEATKYGVLHIATHGILNHKYPLYSSLVLLGDDKEDGLLHTYELYNMQLKAELVALSACNTGVGSIQKGEGAMSIARGFAYAGCPNIAMTLWPVSDQATQLLMENFYTNLMSGMPKAEALKKAKLDFLDAGEGLITVPFFWSGLILVGTPDKLNSLQTISHGLDSTTWIGIAAVILFFLGPILFFMKKRN